MVHKITKDDVHKYRWMFDDMDGLKEKIVFKDKTVYKLSGELHNHTGPAVIHRGDKPGDGDVEYYLMGVKMTERQWEVNTRRYKIEKLVKTENHDDEQNKEDEH